MFDVFSFFVYYSLLFFLIALTQKGTSLKVDKNFDFTLSDNRLTLGSLIGLLLLSFVSGFRKNVGVDWQGYMQIFFDIGRRQNEYRLEWAFKFLNEIINNLGGSAAIMFFVMAFISWYFVFKSVSGRILPLFIYFLFVNEYFFWSMNGVRQFVSIGIFLFSIQFIITRQLYKYVFWIIIAMLFHNSSAILFIFYFLPYNKLNNHKIWVILFLTSAIFSYFSLFTNMVAVFVEYIMTSFTIFSNYNNYLESDSIVAADLNLGFGFYFQLCTNFLIVLLSKNLIIKYPNTRLYFILFMISAIVFNLFYMFSPIGRLNIFILILKCYLLSVISFHYWKIDKTRVLVLALLFIYFLIFSSAIYNSSNLCSPYNFIFS